MAQPQNLNFPYFPFPPHTPPPFHPFTPPSPNPPPHHSPPPSPIQNPPPHPVSPPPPPPHPVSPPPPPHIVPSPPPPKPTPHPHPITPPPPHHPIRPPPPPHIVPSPPPPSPSPGHHTTVIVVVFVSLGGLFFLAFLLACFIKKRKRKMIRETDDFEIDDQVRVHETVVPGPHGEQAVLVTVDEDIHTHETIKKDELVTESSHARSEHHPHSFYIEPLALGTGHHHMEHKS